MLPSTNKTQVTDKILKFTPFAPPVFLLDFLNSIKEKLKLVALISKVILGLHGKSQVLCLYVD